MGRTLKINGKRRSTKPVEAISDGHLVFASRANVTKFLSSPKSLFGLKESRTGSSEPGFSQEAQDRYNSCKRVKIASSEVTAQATPDELEVNFGNPSDDHFEEGQEDYGVWIDDECEVNLDPSWNIANLLPEIEQTAVEIEADQTVIETNKNDKAPFSNYKTKKIRTHLRWKNIMPLFVQAYLAFLDSNGSIPSMKDCGLGDSIDCFCAANMQKTALVDLFFCTEVQKNQPFVYCGNCKSLPVALVEAGMFPVSPTKPNGAVHFSLCDFFVKLRINFAGSAEKIANFYSELLQQGVAVDKQCLSAEKCASAILLYSKMIELAEQEVSRGTVSTSCPACPEIDSKEITDKQYVMLDGNFRLKGTKSLAQNAELETIAGLEGYGELWLSEDQVKEFEKTDDQVNFKRHICYIKMPAFSAPLLML
ncbi:uncharacterized protein EV154DRAFT_495294 [Mucor mucedo]|uniref:uncharacterized protein n=1 Tax=Mucor mucedo TaxID=29922 RepID=UPI00221E91E2|nr:uncharacterized protein EV154DRAFT_495294 [Mucor mucedo]KAI7895552.1 hypothetical protein EV154DRAFT_495294 [Mucor mucedo]